MSGSVWKFHVSILNFFHSTVIGHHKAEIFFYQLYEHSQHHTEENLCNTYLLVIPLRETLELNFSDSDTSDDDDSMHASAAR